MVTSLKGIPKDGVYTGTAECEKFGYGISLKAKFKKGKVVALYQMKRLHNKTKENVFYMQKAWKGMVRRILKSQNKNVDVISGAIYSSQAVWAAYQNAYAESNWEKREKEFKTESYEITDFTGFQRKCFCRSNQRWKLFGENNLQPGCGHGV